MIDLHNHILPGLDDGAADLSESLAIARQFVAEGVIAVAATPHAGADSAEASTEVVRERTASLQTALRASAIPLEVLPGQEIMLTPAVVPRVADGGLLCLGESRTVLVELPVESRPLYLQDTLFHLQLAGLGVVLAHPERYGYLHRDLRIFEELVARGIVLQLTAPAILGEYGTRVRRVAEELLQRGLYALAASDRHHPGPKRSLSAARTRLTTLISEEVADLLLRDNPRRILDGLAVVEPERAQVRVGVIRRLFGPFR